VDSKRIDLIPDEWLPFVVDIKDLHHDPDNARKHTKQNVAVIEASLTRFGQQQLIVAKPDGTVIRGNATLRAARNVGWTQIAIKRFTGTDEEAKAYAIVDNRAAELAVWNYPVLQPQLKALLPTFGAEALGWTDKELFPMLQAQWEPPDTSNLIGGDGDTSDERVSKRYGATKEQRETIDAAIGVLMKARKKLTEGKALEIICQAYLEHIVK
jgi:hypothetical protein